MEYWPELTETQRNLICEFNENFDINKYWSELIGYQKKVVCRYNKKLGCYKLRGESSEI